MKLSSMKNYLYLTGVAIITVACSGTPNNVSISASQGQCVQLGQYQSSAQAGIATAYPMIESNPTATTPYCMALTVQNNNTGNNANNIQITSSGLQVTTTIPGSTSATTTTLSDQYAAGFQISGQSQTINNLVLFDPNNCATTSGANVRTLSTGGGLCTFYLEILQESNPVGVYPYSITFNYTNGNQYYNVNTTINQRTYLYGGDYFSNGLYYMSTNSMAGAANPTTTPPTWQVGLSGDPLLTVRYILEGQYGFVDFAAGNSVYYFNGVTITQIGSALPTTVSSLAYDGAGNIYASTTGSGVYLYNVSNPSQGWQPMTDTSNYILSTTNVIGLKGYEFSTSPTNIIYALTESQAYQCTTNGTTTYACIPSPNTNAPNAFFVNSMDVDNIGTLYAGAGYTSDNTLGVTKVDNGFTGNWTPYTTLPILPYLTVSPYATGMGGIRWTNQNNYSLFIGSVNESGLESTVYSCASSACSPLISNSGVGSPLAGNAFALTTDGQGNLYVGGLNLMSDDYSADVVTGTTGAYQLFGTFATSGVGAGTWTPILQIESSGFPQQINYTAVASMLTSY